MKKLIYILFAVIVGLSCTKRNCVKTSDIAFGDLNEGNREFYSFAYDTFSVNICQYITPNADSVNDTFDFQSNINSIDFKTSTFRVVNACEDVVHSQKNSLPFSFPNPNSLEDGQYEFSFSILLAESKEALSGGGVIRIIRK